MLGLAGIELALGALGFECGAFDREPLAVEALLVLAFELADRLGAGAHSCWRDRRQARVRDRFLDAEPAARLAGALGAMEVERAHAGIAGDAAVIARVGDLH